MFKLFEKSKKDHSTKDLFTIDGEIELENGGDFISGWKIKLPNWIETNSYYPYHPYIPGEGWRNGTLGAMHSMDDLDNLFDESRRKMKPILIFKLEGVILPTGKVQDKNKVTIESKFVKFTGRMLTGSDYD